MSLERLTCQQGLTRRSDSPDVRRVAEDALRATFLHAAQRGAVVWPSVVATVASEPEGILFHVTGLVDCQ